MKSINIRTSKKREVIDLTDQVADIVTKEDLKEGLLSINGWTL